MLLKHKVIGSPKLPALNVELLANVRQAPCYAFSKNSSLFLISALADWKLQRRVRKIIGLSNQVNFFFCKKYTNKQTQSVNQEPDMNET